MSFTCSEIHRAKAFIFASDHGVQTEFYNRKKSVKELLDRFSEAGKDAGLVYFISAPLGSGKTFFIDYTAEDLLGKQTKLRPLWANEVTPQEVKRYKGDILLVDDTDIKRTWDELVNVMDVVNAHVEETGRNAILIGDYSLQNPDLVGKFSNSDYLRNFEPLDRDFLAGVLDQRLKKELQKNGGARLIDAHLYDILTPPGLANVGTFRTVLSSLMAMTDYLPHSGKEARFDLELAMTWIQDFDPLLTSQLQHDCLNRFLDFIAANHPKGTGLGEGLSEDQLFSMLKSLGYETFDIFRDEIIEPFCRNSLLVSNGIPYLDETNTFVRYPEPFLPSIQSLLLAQL